MRRHFGFQLIQSVWVINWQFCFYLSREIWILYSRAIAFVSFKLERNSKMDPFFFFVAVSQIHKSNFKFNKFRIKYHDSSHVRQLHFTRHGRKTARETLNNCQHLLAHYPTNVNIKIALFSIASIVKSINTLMDCIRTRRTPNPKHV